MPAIPTVHFSEAELNCRNIVLYSTMFAGTFPMIIRLVGGNHEVIFTQVKVEDNSAFYKPNRPLANYDQLVVHDDLVMTPHC